MDRQNDASKQPRRPVLCERCQHTIADVTNVQPFQGIEPHFLSSGYTPSEEELSQLKEALKDGEQEIKRYKEDIATLRRMVDQLERAKRDMEAANRQRRAAISAQRRVPVEVWGMIFSTLCLVLHEYSFNVFSPGSPLLQLPAILISQVCVRWNVIAKSIPSIWSSINFAIEFSKYNNPLKIYLSNSKDYPLKLRFGGIVGPTVPRQSLDIWRDLSEYLCRSRELTMAIYFRSHDYARVLPPVHGLKFPVLQSFFEERRLPNEEMWPWFWQAIYRAPRLVQLSSSYLEINPLFSQLTSWELGWLHDAGTFFEVLQSCSRLKSLTLTDISRLNPQSSGISREVKLPYLQQLSISADTSVEGESCFSAIAQSLILPSLLSCRIESIYRPLPTTLLTMVRRSSTSLKRLELKIWPYWEMDHPSLMLDLLQAAPELTHFELTFDRDSRTRVVGDTVTILLSKIKEGPHDFLPKLSFLSVESRNITLNTQLAERVLEVVSSRRETSHPLMEFRIRSTGRRVKKGSVGAKVLERIRTLKEGGVRIVIGGGIRS
ncbi:hypothetical protein L218DRAFT_1076893 [Marasmius fiardii PR-910]|nr:hypothetical protein L218DRAFT_1076893 [Marasmius fiardii PR-910]